MYTLNQIAEAYPPVLQGKERHMLREYLQYKILEAIVASKHGAKFIFLGGTALRLMYNNTRFSEDLDFDNIAVTEDEFVQLTEDIRHAMELQGFAVDISLTGKGAYRCNVRFKHLLHDAGLSPHDDEKILIQVDSLAHGFDYAADLKLLRKFDVTTQVPTTPLDILLSQKLFASVNRPRAKGRDFFDIMFLCGMTKPNYAYLTCKTGVKNEVELRAYMAEKTADYNFGALAKDVAPFLFRASDMHLIEKFPEYFTQVNL